MCDARLGILIHGRDEDPWVVDDEGEVLLACRGRPSPQFCTPHSQYDASEANALVLGLVLESSS